MSDPEGAFEGAGRADAAERRALRVLLVANDGFSAGHVVRTLAIARALRRRASHRAVETRLLLATTSEAHALLASEPIAIVQLPAPAAARRAGFGDLERRRLVRGALAGIADAFAPDLLVVDTFPSGPHGEVAGLCVGRARRALVRRSVPEPGGGEHTLRDGLEDYDLAVIADDPVAHGACLPIRTVRVPPITIAEAHDAKSRAAARAELGLPGPDHGGDRIVLVASGGGGDAEAVAKASAIAAAISRVAPEVTPVLALGPLVRAADGAAVPPTRITTRITTPLTTRAAPLQPLLAAFDGAFTPAGYNTAHELVKAAVPTALFALPRPYDDQAGRVARFASAGLAHALVSFDDDAIAAALSWMSTAPRRSLEAGGADRAADALLDLVTLQAGSAAGSAR